MNEGAQHRSNFGWSDIREESGEQQLCQQDLVVGGNLASDVTLQCNHVLFDEARALQYTHQCFLLGLENHAGAGLKLLAAGFDLVV